MLDEVTREAARRFADRSAVVSTADWALGYSQLDRLSDETAAGLADMGIGDGDVVCLTLPSTAEYLIAYIGAAKIGAITAGVNPRLSPRERSEVVELADPAIVLTTPELAEGLPAGVGAVTLEPADRAEEVLAEVRVSGGTVAALPPDSDRDVAIVFTSGTTGTPKGAVFKNRQLRAIAAADVGQDWEDTWGGGGPMLASTQFAHIGSMTKLPWYLRLGCTLYLLERWRADDVLHIIADTRMASIGGIAPQLALMMRSPLIDELDFSAVRTIIMGGGPSPPALVTEARRRFGADYSIRYSSTESGGVGLGTAFDADEEEALHTVGRPRGDVQIEIRDDGDHPVPEGEIGELCLRTGAMMDRYWRDPAATAEALRGGWLHTGDLAYVDDASCVRLAGRKKEMFIRGGYNVYPMEVEGVLLSHPRVRDVAVVPRPDEVMGEIGVAVVMPTDPDSPPSLEELRSFAVDGLASYKLPEAVRIVDELPMTAMQKVDRRLLAEREAGGADNS